MMYETLAFHLTALYRDFHAYTGEKLKELGLNYGQLPFILYIGNHPGCTPSEVTGQLHMDWGHSQRSLTKLTDAGLIRKERKVPTARICHLFLTEQGQAAFAAGHDVFTDWDSEHLSGLDEDEKQQLFSTLKKLTQSVAKKGNHGTV